MESGKRSLSNKKAKLNQEEALCFPYLPAWNVDMKPGDTASALWPRGSNPEIYSPVSGHLGCFHSRATKDKAAKNISVQIFCGHVFHLSGKQQGVKLLGHGVGVI